MNARRTTLALLGTGAVVAGVLAPSAQAATDATFTLTAGASTVSVSVPESTVNLGSAAVNATSLTGNLGTVSVTDNRAKLLAAWTVTATSTDFVLDGGDSTKAEQVVAKSAIAYAPGTVTLGGPGTGTFTAAPLASMAAPGLVGTYAGVAGSRTASWAPNLTFLLTANQIAGTYKGTITHSVTTTV